MRLIALIAQAQEPDGDIHTDITSRQKAARRARFGNPMIARWYNFGPPDVPASLTIARR